MRVKRAVLDFMSHTLTNPVFLAVHSLWQRGFLRVLAEVREVH
jgi:hypothetical protein